MNNTELTTLQKLDVVGAGIFTEKQNLVLKTLLTPPPYGTTLDEFARVAGLSNQSFSSVVRTLNKRVTSLIERDVSPWGSAYGVWYLLDEVVLNKYLDAHFLSK